MMIVVVTNSLSLESVDVTVCWCWATLNRNETNQPAGVFIWAESRKMTHTHPELLLINISAQSSIMFSLMIHYYSVPCSPCCCFLLWSGRAVLTAPCRQAVRWDALAQLLRSSTHTRTNIQLRRCEQVSVQKSSWKCVNTEEIMSQKAVSGFKKVSFTGWFGGKVLIGFRFDFVAIRQHFACNNKQQVSLNSLDYIWENIRQFNASLNTNKLFESR